MSAIQSSAGRAPAQSTFVNVVAWISIAISGMGTCIGLMQFVLYMTFFRTDEMQQQFANSPGANPVAITVFQYFPWFIAGFIVVSATTLAASIGLLRRQDWGRLTFIGILVLGIAWNVLGLVLQQYVLSSFPKMPVMPDQPGPSFDTMMLGMQIFSVVCAVAICALHVWIIKRLMSPAIVAEFRSA